MGLKLQEYGHRAKSIKKFKLFGASKSISLHPQRLKMQFDFFKLQKTHKFRTKLSKSGVFVTPNAKRYTFFPFFWLTGYLWGGAWRPFTALL